MLEHFCNQGADVCLSLPPTSVQNNGFKIAIATAASADSDTVKKDLQVIGRAANTMHGIYHCLLLQSCMEDPSLMLHLLLLLLS